MSWRLSSRTTTSWIRWESCCLLLIIL